MPITNAAKKALRSSRRKRIYNLRRKRVMKSAVKEVNDLLSKGEVQDAQQKLPEAYKAIDKAAKRGVIKDNTAARKKSNLSRAVKEKHKA